MKHKSDFYQFAKKYPIDKDDVLDIYQDAYIAFYENVTCGKLVKLTSTVKTYIFSVGKYLILNHLKKSKKTVKQEIDNQMKDQDMVIVDQLILSEEQQLLLEKINQLGEGCQKVLTYFYYHHFKISEIMISMNYKSENVTKSKKSQCLKQLKKLLQ